METLNEKIYDILGRFSMGEIDSTAPTHKQATNEIEKLILQEKIDLLEEMRTQKDFDAIVLNIPIRVYNLRMELLKLNN